MGTLGISLLFVGITLVINAVCVLKDIDKKSMAIMNMITAFVLLFVNLRGLINAENIYDYQAVASGFLFAFTYLFITLNNFLHLDLRPYGWFCLFVTIYAVIMAIDVFSFDPRLTFLWASWAILWLDGFIELSLGIDLGKKTYPALAIFVGLFAAFIPAMFMLLNKW